MNIDVFEYDSFKLLIDRILLGDGRKRSIRQLSQWLNYSSDRALGMVYKEQRPPSVDMVERLSKWMELSDKGERYLSLLAKKQSLQIKSEDVSPVEQALTRLRPNSAQFQVVDSKDFDVLTEWYYFPMLEVIDLLGSESTIDAIVESFEGSLLREDVDDAIKKMFVLGVVKVDSGIVSRTTDEFYRTTIDVPSNAIRKYHKNTMARATEAIDEQGVLDREFISKTVVVNSTDMQRIKKDLREGFEEIHSSAMSSKNVDSVYQINLQFFKQATVKKKRDLDH